MKLQVHVDPSIARLKTEAGKARERAIRAALEQLAEARRNSASERDQHRPFAGTNGTKPPNPRS